MRVQAPPVPEGRAQCSWTEHPGGPRCPACSAHVALQKPLATSVGSKVSPQAECVWGLDCPTAPCVLLWPRWQGPQIGRPREGPAMQTLGLGCRESWSQALEQLGLGLERGHAPVAAGNAAPAGWPAVCRLSPAPPQSSGWEPPAATPRSWPGNGLAPGSAGYLASPSDHSRGPKPDPRARLCPPDPREGPYSLDSRASFRFSESAS